MKRLNHKSGHEGMHGLGTEKNGSTVFHGVIKHNPCQTGEKAAFHGWQGFAECNAQRLINEISLLTKFRNDIS